MKPRFQRIGIVANVEKKRVVPILREVIPQLVSRGFDVFLDEELTATPLTIDLPVGIPDDVDLLIAVGGDGTLLHFARRFAETETPILGLRGGRLGFLAEGRTDRVAQWLQDGRYILQSRMRIAADVRENGNVAHSFSALNDIVVHGARYSRVIDLRLRANGNLIREYTADGLIVATPTGSTAYSLSAGGPLLEPTIEAVVLTPLSPHTMNVRPMVVEADQRVVVEVISEGSDVQVTVDGQAGVLLGSDQTLEVYRSDLHTNLVVPDDYDFFRLLREKL